MRQRGIRPQQPKVVRKPSVGHTEKGLRRVAHHLFILSSLISASDFEPVHSTDQAVAGSIDDGVVSLLFTSFSDDAVFFEFSDTVSYQVWEKRVV